MGLEGSFEGHFSSLRHRSLWSLSFQPPITTPKSNRTFWIQGKAGKDGAQVESEKGTTKLRITTNERPKKFANQGAGKHSFVVEKRLLQKQVEKRITSPKCTGREWREFTKNREFQE